MITKRFERIHSTILEWDNKRIREDQGQVCCVIETSVLSEPVVNNMDNIINAYIELCDICDDLKNIYGLPIMIVILFLSAGMVFMLYFIILVLMSYLKVTDDTYLNVTLVSWIIFLIMVLTSTVTKTMKQNKKTIKFANLLKLRAFTNNKIKKKLDKFSSVISHLKLEFTACDIMPLDHTLIAIISSTTATYLIIAVQFRISSPPN
ncbi:putative gustatory receptor 28b [Microplitis mediator]|uniref:putative gustatory receptor 28b n=1 Tax=Microplitis mediator TaxID=375433 RepID=UPI002552DFF6|nr:putative gustatory receptor 28b [Microplitis mediator]